MNTLRKHSRKKVFRIFGHTITLRDILVIKTIICVGLLATYFLPPIHSAIISAAANMLWLWKT